MGKPKGIQMNLKSVGQFIVLTYLLAFYCSAEVPNGATDLSKPAHSSHGEAFNEGARQAAYLMTGMAKVDIKPTSTSPLAKQFVNQGVSQLHGFWFLEAERSFRQAAAIDPECGLAYWGMAVANKDNKTRAKAFIEKGLKCKEKVSDRERRYIDTVAKYLGADKPAGEEDKRSPSDRARDLAQDIERIILDFPDDIEAKAWLCFRLWENEHEDLRITSRLAVDALLSEIFQAAPMHPAHHYRIHLWDGTRGTKALDSAAKCGPSSPGIAHMWHMPGHTYSELRRYHDASYQQEASARVDHAHMMRDRLLPDQIHNFAHNNEWLIRNWLAIGQVQDALALSKNMISLPRHPKYNRGESRGSSSLGRERLLETLARYRLWEQALALEASVYLDPGQSQEARADRLQILAMAAYGMGAVDRASGWAGELRSEVDKRKLAVEKLEELPPEPPAYEPATEEQKAKTEKSKKEDAERVAKLEKERNDLKRWQRALSMSDAFLAAHELRWQDAVTALEKAESHDTGLQAEWMLNAGKVDESLKKIDEWIAGHQGEVLPLAYGTYIHWKAGKIDSAKKHFETLRPLACTADLDTSLLVRLNPFAVEIGIAGKWAIERTIPTDLGERPQLDLLGPRYWSPYQAEPWILENSQGGVVSSKQMLGRPTLVIFYLGFGCLHCVEQLQKFSPMVEEFKKQGIEVMAVSSENLKSLQGAIGNLEKPLAMPIHVDPQAKTFRAYRCFDDFEQLPLHGTFLIDADGKVLWQDIGFEPFMDIDFALSESQRQLRLQRETGH